MLNQFSRTALLIGDEGVEKLNKASVAVFGVGGVGSYTVEALARSGVGSITVLDNDTVALTNINRQLVATTKTIGKQKVDVAKERILDVNPDANVTAICSFYNEETADNIDLSKFDYIVDAIDTVSSKLLLIERAKAADVPIISCMGAGNKLDPTKFEVTDIYKTSVCPLARVMRYELKRRKIKKLKVVYSTEVARKPQEGEEKKGTAGRSAPGSMAFVPSVAGLIAAGEVVKDIIGE